MAAAGLAFLAGLAVALLAPPAAAAGGLLPGGATPAFAVRSLDGDQFAFQPAAGKALVLHALDSTDAFSVAMWTSDFSLDSFLLDVAAGGGAEQAIYLMASFGGEAASNAAATAEVQWMQQRLQERAAALGWPPARVAEVLSLFAFAADAVGQWGGAAQWIPQTLALWPQNVTTLRVPGALSVPVTRLDGEYTVIPWPSEPSQGPATIVDLGNGCGSAAASAPAAATRHAAPGAAAAGGGAALLSFPSGADGRPVAPCTFAALGAVAQAANASVAVLFPIATKGAAQAASLAPAPQPGQFPPLAMPNCTSNSTSCAESLSIPLTVISMAAGLRVRASLQAGASLEATLADVPRHAMELAVDHAGAARQVGWRKFATLRMLSWAAQFEGYNSRVAANLTRPATTVVAFGPTKMKGKEGVLVNVTLPSRAELAQAGSVGRIVLDMALGCEGPLDETCAVWDRVVTLAACCSRQDGGGVGGGVGGNCSEFELGRWITPFRRGVGRWLTDVSPLGGLLLQPDAQSRCSLRMTTDWWASAWYPSLSLRFEAAASPSAEQRAQDGRKVSPAGAGAGAGSAGADPSSRREAEAGVESWGPSASATPLFRGGKFGPDYNNNRTVRISPPPGATRAALYAVITGHGSDNNGCGEFCPTEHVFRFAGTNVSVAYADAGDFWGSTFTVAEGTIPSQHGTWQFGRDGWFDGNKVRAFTADVTDLVVAGGGGAPVEVRYWGLYKGQTPHPTTSPGVIIMWSWVAWW